MNGDTGPCAAWDIEWCCPLQGVSPAVTGLAADAATEILWGLSGRQFGFCDYWLRPCRQECVSGPSYGSGWWWDDSSSWIHPELIDGAWTNVVCGACLGDCGCSHASQVILPPGAYQVLSVVIDDEVLPTGGAYRLDDFRTLVRTDGGQWPLCQEWGTDSGPDTWFLQVRFGRPVPAIGTLAVSELASELVSSCSGDPKCKLPQRVTSIDRNGLTIAFDDVQSLLRGGQTGLTKCDMFLATYNPHGLSSRSRVYSPDVPRPRVMAAAPPAISPITLSTYGAGTYGAGTYGGV